MADKFFSPEWCDKAKEVLNANPAGTDARINLPTWSHNLHVDNGASVFTGNNLVINGGLTSGTGTLESTGLNERTIFGGQPLGPMLAR
jgi:hypothetical protein